MGSIYTSALDNLISASVPVGPKNTKSTNRPQKKKKNNYKLQKKKLFLFAMPIMKDSRCRSTQKNKIYSILGKLLDMVFI